MDDIEIFNNSAIILNKKVPPKILSWITIVIILLLFLLIISLIQFNTYETVIGIYHNNQIEINNIDFPINKNYKMYICQKLYNYKIIKIQDNKIIIDIELDKDLKIENNILKINILRNRTNLFNIIKSKWKEVFFIEKNE